MNHVYVNHFLDSVRLSRSFRPAQVLQIQINAGIIYPKLIDFRQTTSHWIYQHKKGWYKQAPQLQVHKVGFDSSWFFFFIHHGIQSSSVQRLPAPSGWSILLQLKTLEIPSRGQHFPHWDTLCNQTWQWEIPGIHGFDCHCSKYIYICLSIGGWNSIYPGNGHHLPGFEWKSKTKNHPRAFSRQLWLPEGSGPSLGRVSGKVLKQFLGQTCGCLADSISTSIVYNALIYIYIIWRYMIWIYEFIYWYIVYQIFESSSSLGSKTRFSIDVKNPLVPPAKIYNMIDCP